MSEQATAVSLERHDAIAAPEGGRIAVAPHLELVTPEPIPPYLSFEEIETLDSLSQGNTATQAARELYTTKSEIDDDRHSFMKKFGTHSMALVTDQAIRRGILTIEVLPQISVIEGLTRADQAMIRLYAKGVSNHRIAKDSSARTGQHVSPRRIEHYHDRLLERLGAWNRAHAVRRAHELGILGGITPDASA